MDRSDCQQSSIWFFLLRSDYIERLHNMHGDRYNDIANVWRYQCTTLQSDCDKSKQLDYFIHSLFYLLFTACCDTDLFQSEPYYNTTNLLSQIFELSNPTGIIGTANCSNTASSVLCFCGNFPLDPLNNICWTGSTNGHVYLLEYCNSTTSVCQVCLFSKCLRRRAEFVK